MKSNKCFQQIVNVFLRRDMPHELMCLTKTLSAFEVVHDGNRPRPRLFLNAHEAGLLVRCPEIVDKYPIGTLSENFYVVDVDGRPYDMFLSHSKNDDGEIIYTLDSGWHRFVKIHNLKAGDEISFYRVVPTKKNGCLYYAIMYTRKDPSYKDDS